MKPATYIKTAPGYMTNLQNKHMNTPPQATNVNKKFNSP